MHNNNCNVIYITCMYITVNWASPWRIDHSSMVLTSVTGYGRFGSSGFSDHFPLNEAFVCHPSYKLTV